MTPKDKKAQNREKLQSLLRELFQFDSADLDFGIYRIMNQKRDEIERFIEEDLLDEVADALAEFRSVEREELESKLDRKRQDIGEEGFDERGEVREEVRGLAMVEDYLRLKEKLESLEVVEETEARVFNDLYAFFRRYYDNGDFLTERRWSSKQPKFTVPYNGEEVLLHWANHDHYYVKTTERFSHYRFTVGDYVVWFRLQTAEVPQDNVKGRKRHFVLRGENPVQFASAAATLSIFFEYRPISDEEEARFVGLYNARQSKSARRKKIDRATLCQVLELEILDRIEEADLKARLAVSAEGQGSSVLSQHLSRYAARNTMDYFVHKDLGRFLHRELDYFLKGEVLRLEDIISGEAPSISEHLLARGRVIKHIADRIIAFLAQIEDFQKRLFEKRKFVVQTDYCVTLDRVSEEFYPDILANEAQLEEWRRLYSLEAWQEHQSRTGQVDAAFLHNHPYMMVDTSFFSHDFKERLLGTFGDLDGGLDGLLVQGENFQVLNLLSAKYGGKVGCIYIDPPYNKGGDFLYKDAYQHSSWLAMMENRLTIAQRILTEDGLIFSSIDENEVDNLSHLLSRVFPERVAIVVIKNNPKGRSLDRYLSTSHEYVLAFAKTQTELVGIPKDEAQVLSEYPHEDGSGRYRLLELRNTHRQFNRETRPNLWYALHISPEGDQVTVTPTPDSREVYPIWEDGLDGCWTWGKDRSRDNAHLLVARQVRQRWKVYRKDYAEGATYIPKTIWDDTELRTDHAQQVLDAMMGTRLFPSPKPPALIKRVLQLASERGEFVLDFFAGSGTTAHAVIDFNRDSGGAGKYILVEMGEYFDMVLKPRVEKAVFSPKWEGGMPQDRRGQSHMFKYQRIESYEDALNNLQLREPAGPQHTLLYQDADDYMLSYMLQFETENSPTLLTQEAFEKPFSYTLKIQEGDESPRDMVVDLVETFHYLIGMHVRRLEQHQHQNRRYVISRGEVRSDHGADKVMTIWRETAGLDLEQEADWANGQLLAEPIDRVYVNGPSFIDKAEPLEITFRERMEAPIDGA